MSRAQHRPHILDANLPEDRQTLRRLREDRSITVPDHIEGQLRELSRIEHPERAADDPAIGAEVEARLRASGREGLGRWVYYPWSRQLLHLLPPDDFRKVRSDRNRYKITEAEAEILRGARVGVVGLSVGRAVMSTLITEGIGGHVRLSDHDDLELSNLNRLGARLDELGLNKAVSAARAASEIDPYVEVEIFPEGLSDQSFDDFLLGQGKLDVLIEECDEPYVKVALRQRARAHGIPVLMHTSDRGMLDIERFDLEPERPVFHGLVGDLDAETLRRLSTKEKVPYVLKILDADAMSTRMLGSMLEINQSLSAWPQLASDVDLGGAALTYIARQILLGRHRRSGRYYLDLDHLVGPDIEAALERPEVDRPQSPAPASEVTVPVARPGSGRAVEAQEIEYLVHHASLAPSAGNMQPWRFVARDDRVEVWRHRDWHSTLDFDYGGTHLALGAAVENLVITGSTLDLHAEVTSFPDARHADWVASVSLQRRSLAVDPLAAHVRERVTNRRFEALGEVAEKTLAALVEVAEAHGAHLHTLRHEAERARLADQMASLDRLCFLNAEMHREMMGEFRWSHAEAIAAGDGFALDTLELSAVDRAGLKIIARPEVMRFLGGIQRGDGLGDLSRRWVAPASAMCLLSVPSAGPRAYFDGGRLMQRLWLRATSLGIALQPMTGLPYLFARLEGGGEGLSTAEQNTLRDLRQEYLRLFPRKRRVTELMLFRVLLAEAPSARSMRKPLTEILHFG